MLVDSSLFANSRTCRNLGMTRSSCTLDPSYTCLMPDRTVLWISQQPLWKDNHNISCLRVHPIVNQGINLNSLVTSLARILRTDRSCFHDVLKQQRQLGCYCRRNFIKRPPFTRHQWCSGWCFTSQPKMHNRNWKSFTQDSNSALVKQELLVTG